jgi:proteasome lid subunit RPN8/RPN11
VKAISSPIGIPGNIFHEMLAHCLRGHPEEACGILAGRNCEVMKLYPMTNAEPSPVSYLMEPKEQFRALKDMRENNLSMVAVFHSHPASAAYPSAKDVELAFYDDCAYLIVGLSADEPVVRAFTIREGSVREVEIVINKKPEVKAGMNNG